MNIFPEINISETEATVIAEKLSDPAVKKYLHMLAYNTAASIVLSFPKDGEPDEVHLRAVAKAQGQLGTLETLLSFQAADVNQQSS